MAKTTTINEIKNIVANTECKVETFHEVIGGDYTVELHTSQTEQGSYSFTGSREEFIKRAQRALRQENYSPARDKVLQANIAQRQGVMVWLRANLGLWKFIEAAQTVVAPMMKEYDEAQQALRHVRYNDWKAVEAARKVADRVWNKIKTEVRKLARKLNLEYDGADLLLNGYEVSIGYLYQTMPESWKRMAQQAA